MTSKIKVDNIENQCGGAVVTKCGATTTISGSVVKADNIQAADGGNLINQCGTTITLGASGDTINLAVVHHRQVLVERGQLTGIQLLKLQRSVQYQVMVILLIQQFRSYNS
jgi:UDP-N-acetylenolpyruvoylglucosamine reductase